MQVMGTSLEPLAVWKRGHDLESAARFASSLLATFVRAGAGTYVATLGDRPKERLVLYEMEGCPYSRKVREALSMLDLDALVKPSPEGAEHHRRELERERGEAKVPFLVDPNTGVKMGESDDIVRYLFETYGDGRVPPQLALGKVTQKSSELASKLRGEPAKEARPADLPERPLELWSYEGSPYCRLVRETLGTYALPYVLHNVARLSPRRKELVARAGKMQVPFLYDPNNGTELLESDRICAYIEDRYGKKALEA